MNDAMIRIGNFFRDFREQSEMDPEFIVAELGLVSTSRLFEYESGNVQIPLEDLFAMANLYNIPPDVVVRFLYDLSIAADASSKVGSR
jgi:transcriptional regulator with XRE-family HTH domain